MISFPKLTMLDVNFPDGYLGNKIWHQYNHVDQNSKLVVDRYALMPSMDKDILYIDNINAIITQIIDVETGESNYINSSKLSVVSKDVEILMDDISIDVSSDKKKGFQELLFVDVRQPLFKIDDMARSREIDIGFMIKSIDSRNKKFINSAYFNMFYNVSTRKGDVNGDGKVDLLDIVALSDYVTRNRDVAYSQSGEMYNDGIIDIMDVMSVTDIVLDD